MGPSINDVSSNYIFYLFLIIHGLYFFNSHFGKQFIKFCSYLRLAMATLVRWYEYNKLGKFEMYEPKTPQLILPFSSSFGVACIRWLNMRKFLFNILLDGGQPRGHQAPNWALQPIWLPGWLPAGSPSGYLPAHQPGHEQTDTTFSELATVLKG